MFHLETASDTEIAKLKTESTLFTLPLSRTTTQYYFTSSPPCSIQFNIPLTDLEREHEVLEDVEDLVAVSLLDDGAAAGGGGAMGSTQTSLVKLTVLEEHWHFQLCRWEGGRVTGGQGRVG